MSWNYRVIRSNAGELSIHEVYYDETGGIKYWSSYPDAVAGENISELATEIDHMRDALNRPILNLSDLESDK